MQPSVPNNWSREMSENLGKLMAFMWREPCCYTLNRGHKFKKVKSKLVFFKEIILYHLRRQTWLLLTTHFLLCSPTVTIHMKMWWEVLKVGKAEIFIYPHFEEHDQYDQCVSRTLGMFQKVFLNNISVCQTVHFDLNGTETCSWNNCKPVFM